MPRGLFRVAVAALGLVAALAPVQSRADHASIPVGRLQAYSKLDPSGVTVSGISSGAFFAHQFHVAFSSLVRGAGMVDGGLYRCAEQVGRVSPPFGNPFLLLGVSREVVAALAVAPPWGATTSGRPAGSSLTSRTPGSLRGWPGKPMPTA